MNILVSSCLLGLDCRYNATSCFSESVAALSGIHTLIPICPEQMGGLPTPRQPLERSRGLVIDKDSRDYTAALEKGADEVLRIAKLCNCTHAITKSRSPSCGCGLIYDGTFSRHMTEGNGIAVDKLLAAGIKVTDENHLSYYM